MNIQSIDRRILLTHLHAVEEKFPLRFVGLLEPGSATHVLGDDAVNFLGEDREGLSYLGVAGAEAELSERLGHPVGIILRRELRGNDEKRILAGLKPI